MIDSAERLLPGFFDQLMAAADLLRKQGGEQLGELLLTMPPQKPVAVDKIQSLDFVRQSLEDCALLLHYLSEQQSEQLQTQLLLETARQKMKLSILLP